MTAKGAAIHYSSICASALGLLLLAGCGRYADFTLPAPKGEPREIRWRWHAPKEPLLRPAADEVDVLNPSMANGKLFYSVFDGKTWYTALDGKRVLAPQGWEGGYIAANGSVVFHGGQYWHWYHVLGPDIPKIAFARSANGQEWDRDASAALDVGPRGSWDERGVADPYVIEAGGSLYLYYLGQDRARRQRLGVATSTDGHTWTKLRSNPILEVGEPGSWDAGGLGEPAVWTSHGAWWMLYTGRARDEVRRIGLARSTDGVRWEKVKGFVIAGDQPWNAKVVCDPHVEPQPDGRVKVWFGGGDVAHPAERIHGQIGLGELIPES